MAAVQRTSHYVSGGINFMRSFQRFTTNQRNFSQSFHYRTSSNSLMQRDGHSKYVYPGSLKVTIGSLSNVVGLAGYTVTDSLLRPLAVSWSVCRTYSKKKGKEKGSKAHKKVTLTDEQLEGIVNLEKVREEYAYALEDLKEKFIHQLTVRTSQGVFDRLQVKTPDGNFPLIQLGQVAQKSPQLIAINLAASPQYIQNVKEALVSSGLNVNPQQDGTSLFINLPPVTREHRETLSKNAKALSEKTKKHLREIYSKHSRKIKNSKEGHSSDDLTAADDMIQDMMHAVLHQIEEMTALKQKELLGGK